MNKPLTDISLSENRIGDRGALALAEALKVNWSLTDIKLNENEIGDKGAFALATALKWNRTLTVPRTRCPEAAPGGRIRRI